MTQVHTSHNGTPVYYCIFVLTLTAFRQHGIKASMYNKEFVGCVLSLIAQYCPEASYKIICEILTINMCITGNSCKLWT